METTLITNETLKSFYNEIDYLKEEDKEEIEKAVNFIIEKHKDQYRKSGEPYYIHPIEAARILAQLKLDKTTIISALLHDILEDTDTDIDTLKNLFGEKVALIVDGVTKIGKYQFSSKEEAQAENFRKMIVSMAKDIRVLLVKLADRLHNMRTLDALREDKRVRIAKETLEIYAPLASRLGLWAIKREIEDLAFKYIYPEEYKKVSTYFAISKEKEEKYLKEEIIPQIEKVLREHNITNFEIQYRFKHLYSIFEKTLRKNLKLSDIYDVYGVRVLVEEVHQCYLVLGLIHSLWHPVPGKLKDYISLPKSNLYQALHTTVVGPKGKFVEIQIKTYQMHKIAEEGIAAHWRYKGGSTLTEKDLQSFVWLRNLLQTVKENEAPSELLSSVKSELTPEEIFVFTPKGDLIKLPVGSTPVDFAYNIHTQLGHKTSGAKINGKLVPLDTKLQNGDVVEIITSQNHKPSRDWLDFVVTSKAKTNIKHFLAKIEKEQAIKFGEKLLDKILKKFNKKTSSLTEEEKKKLLERFNYKTFEDFLAAVGDSKISLNKIIKIFRPAEEKPEEQKTEKKHKDVVIEVDGVSNILSYVAKCCMPLPGDEIIGVVSKGKGIAIHRKECPNVINIEKTNPEKLVSLIWKTDKNHLYQTNIKIISEDRVGLLADVSSAVASTKTNIIGVNTQTLKNGKAITNLKLNVADKQQLDNIINAIKKVKGVNIVERVIKGVSN